MLLFQCTYFPSLGTEEKVAENYRIEKIPYGKKEIEIKIPEKNYLATGTHRAPPGRRLFRRAEERSSGNCRLGHLEAASRL
jgi:hypothetical protein